MKTILLVDDVPANLGVLFDTLQGAGYESRVAENGERALQQVRRKRPDLILLDVTMPGLDGFETCRRLKAEPGTADIPVIFMTALTDVVDKVKGFEAGAVDYITKPLHPEEVVARVRTHLQLRELQQSFADEVQRRADLEEQLRQSLDRAVVMVADDGSVPFRTRRAAQMLARHCDLPEDSCDLPAAITTWLKTGTGPTLDLSGAGGLLRLRRYSTGTDGDLSLLVLEESGATMPSLDGLMRLHLTPREAEVLYWIAHGKTNPEIAIILDSAPATVKNQVHCVLEKLGVETRTAAARVALEVLGAGR